MASFTSKSHNWVEAWQGVLPVKSIETLKRDCAIIFDSRSINTDEENYSSGSTYFIKSNETPQNSLERIALEIFKYHSRDIKDLNPDLSGAEWWSQVIHPFDDIGVHWDRDYGLEEEKGEHVHPLYGTVTYLSSKGAPTVVFNKIGSNQADEDILGKINEMAISSTQIGNHLRFNGNLLHAAPANFLHDEEEDEEDDSEDDEDESEDEVDDLERLEKLFSKLPNRRISFLVNIWINHIPSQSQRYSPPQISSGSQLPSLSNDNCYQFLHFENKIHSNIPSSAFELQMISKESIERNIELEFNNHDLVYRLNIPLPSIEILKTELENKKLLFLKYPQEDYQIDLLYSEHQIAEDEDDDEEEELEADDLEDNEEDEDDDEEEAEEEQQPKKKAKY